MAGYTINMPQGDHALVGNFVKTLEGLTGVITSVDVPSRKITVHWSHAPGKHQTLNAEYFWRVDGVTWRYAPNDKPNSSSDDAIGGDA